MSENIKLVRKRILCAYVSSAKWCLCAKLRTQKRLNSCALGFCLDAAAPPAVTRQFVASNF